MERKGAMQLTQMWDEKWNGTQLWTPARRAVLLTLATSPHRTQGDPTCGTHINSANPGGSLILLVCLFILNASTFLWAFSFWKKPHTLKGTGFKTLQKHYCWDSLVQHPENLFRFQNESFIRQELPHTTLGTH